MIFQTWLLALHKQLPKACTPYEKTALQRRIEATDGQIDGGPAVRADGGGDRDCGGGGQVNALAKVFKAESPCAYLAILNDGKDYQKARNEIQVYRR